MPVRDAKTRKTIFWIMLFFVAVSGFIPSGASCSQGTAVPFPTYGAGSIEVRFFTDYFCPPCRALEAPVEPVLRELLKKKAITLTLVDVPVHRYSPLYAQYFLYSLAEKRDLEHAFKVRNILFETAAGAQVTTKGQLEEILKAKNIPFTVLDLKPTLNRYNALITEDGIRSTPTCVIIRGGRKESFTGRQDIMKALKNLP